eukprot:359823-Chlamydomonas_euryale.AAC.3
MHSRLQPSLRQRDSPTPLPFPIPNLAQTGTPFASNAPAMCQQCTTDRSPASGSATAPTSPHLPSPSPILHKPAHHSPATRQQCASKYQTAAQPQAAQQPLRYPQSHVPLPTYRPTHPSQLTDPRTRPNLQTHTLLPTYRPTHCPPATRQQRARTCGFASKCVEMTRTASARGAGASRSCLTPGPAISSAPTTVAEKRPSYV